MIKKIDKQWQWQLLSNGNRIPELIFSFPPFQDSISFLILSSMIVGQVEVSITMPDIFYYSEWSKVSRDCRKIQKPKLAPIYQL